MSHPVRFTFNLPLIGRYAIPDVEGIAYVEMDRQRDLQIVDLVIELYDPETKIMLEVTVPPAHRNYQYIFDLADTAVTNDTGGIIHQLLADAEADRADAAYDQWRDRQMED